MQLTRLRNLISLQLANNRFSGGLENQQVPLSLFSLNMSSNLLTGQVPNLHHELFPELRVIDLSNNKIEGYVPDFLETADKVAGMNWVLSGNPLWCPIPPWKVLLATTCQRVPHSFPRRCAFFESSFESVRAASSPWHMNLARLHTFVRRALGEQRQILPAVRASREAIFWEPVLL